MVDLSKNILQIKGRPIHRFYGSILCHP
ncbi:uncharacterized protein METZ01_LOCUS165839 [marine metagenome]|uniref:Uncharacterized protein n=1 Tax=marine metagenome TaxID=408172 RepID=A0A382BGP0_9ZZZZ